MVTMKGLSDPKSIHAPGSSALREPRLSKLNIPKPLNFGSRPVPPHPIAMIHIAVAPAGFKAPKTPRAGKK